MRIAIASAFSCGVGVWARLRDEGNDVLVWRGNEKQGSPELLTSHRRVGEGIVPLCDSWYGLLAWAKDGIRKGEPTIMLFDSSGLGIFADEARKSGVYVVGGGRFCDRLEKDRVYGRKVAESVGIQSPPVQEFRTIDECLSFARSGGVSKPVYWKTSAYIDGDATHKCDDSQELVDYLTYIRTRGNPNMSCILEEKIEGAPLSVHRYWNGRAWVGPYMVTIERKKFFTGELGPSTGCSLNGVGYYADENPLIASISRWDAFTQPFLKSEAPPGLYDINFIVHDEQAFMLEWTPRMGWDSEGTSHLLFDDYSAWLWYVATGQGYAPEPSQEDVAVAIRLTVMPAPFEHLNRDDKGSSVGVPIRGDVGDLWSGGFVGYQLMVDPVQGLSVASSEGLVGLAAAVGTSVTDLSDECTEFAKERLWSASPLQYRIDAGDAIAEDAEAIIEAGFDLPAGFLR